MASAPAILPFPPPMSQPMPDASTVDLDSDDQPIVSREGGVKITALSDGSAIVDFNPSSNDKPKSDKFNANLAKEMEQADLSKIASDLLTGIEADESSRRDQIEMLAKGIELLGFTIEQARGDAGTSTAPVEGMSTVRHPLLADACLNFNATARGELLPAAGPIKIRDDRPEKPAAQSLMNSGDPQAIAGQLPVAPGMPAVPPDEPRDELADALEKDMNHFLTDTASEYYPDTDQMFFRVGFGGWGVKKVYNCPLRRRPVSESINIEDFIVSNSATDLGNARRKTHKIKMRPSTLRRMQLLGVYVDSEITIPTPTHDDNAVDQAKSAISGVQPQVSDPKDADHELYECYCELDLPEYAPTKFRNKGLPLPYRVTIERESKKVLEIRRNWKQSDEECREKEYFVEYCFVKAFGFYGIGLLHVLGNTTKALTSIWRELIDAGSFANFPAFLYAKGAGRQLTNQFRAGPGQGIGLDVGLAKLSDAVMPFPYKDVSPAFAGFASHVEELGMKLGGTAQIAVGEGKQDAPVGTTLALIEQATKPTGAVMKRLHQSQSKEFKLLKERFEEDPEAFWRFNKRPSMPWVKDQLVQALSDYDLVPVSDPNNPTHLHRAAKSQWLVETATQAPGLLDPKKVYLRAAEGYEIPDPEDLLAPPQPPQQPQIDPLKAAELQIKNQKLQSDASAKALSVQSDMAKAQMQHATNLAEIDARTKLAMIEQETERMRLASTVAIHSDKADEARSIMSMKLGSQHALAAADKLHDVMTNPPQIPQENSNVVG